MGPREDFCICPIPFSWFWTPFFCDVSPEIVIFHEPFIIETCNKCHWIWHASNSKYGPLKQFWCIFSSQNPQNVKLLPEIVIFQELLIAETWNLQHWNQHALKPKYMPLKPFQCIFPSQNNKMWNFGCFLNSPWQKTEKLQFAQRKSVCKSAHIGFLGMPIAMHYVRTMCDRYFLSYYGLSAFFYGKVKILGYETWCRGKWDPRKTAAYVPSHFHGFEPHVLWCVS